MSKKLAHIILILLCVSAPGLDAQKYFVSFSDKNNNTFSTNLPEDFLSQRAIERRVKQNIPVTEEDLPVTSYYVDSVGKMGVNALWSSKWLNGVIVESENQELMDTITRVSFVSDVKLIYKESATASMVQKSAPEPELNQLKLKSSTEYGLSWVQTQTVNGHYLHSNGYLGENMEIAVLDGGFKNANTLKSFVHLWDNGQILSQRDIVDPTDNFYETDSHGSNVLSVMGGFVEGELKGSAPEAKYHLIRTEDGASEFPIEEYNWVIGAEYADSIGADIINSSLGYYVYDGDFEDYTTDDMDGVTTIVVKGAETAFSKGMIVVNSAGNEGASTWGKIISPADGEHVLSVAAMQSDSVRASFSSYGYSADGRVKPDVTAIGENTYLQYTNGEIGSGNGTSFSAPVITGFVACLWQAFPNSTNQEIIQMVKTSSHQYDVPDNSFGYGIPDFNKALNIDDAVIELNQGEIVVYPNPFCENINISSNTGSKLIESIHIFDLTGRVVFKDKNVYCPSELLLGELSKGVYILKIKGMQTTYVGKIVKRY